MDLEGILSKIRERQIPNDFTWIWNIKEKQIEQKQFPRYRGGSQGDEQNSQRGLRSTNFQLQKKKCHENIIFRIENRVKNMIILNHDRW